MCLQRFHVSPPLEIGVGKGERTDRGRVETCGVKKRGETGTWSKVVKVPKRQIAELLPPTTTHPHRG